MKNNRFFLLYLATFFIGFSYGFSYIYLLLVEKLGGSLTNFGSFLTVLGCFAIIAVLFSGKAATKYGPVNVATFGSLGCVIGFCILGSVSSINLLFYVAGSVTVLGYAYAYAVSPMIINNAVSDHSRVKHLSSIAAFVVLGIGMGPLVGKFLLDQGVLISTIYYFAAFNAFIAMILFYFQRHRWPDIPVNTPLLNTIPQHKPMTIFHSKARYGYYLTFCSGAIYGLLMNFQVLYAEARHFNFAI